MKKDYCEDCQHWKKAPKTYTPHGVLNNTFTQVGIEQKKACYLKNRWHFETLAYIKSHGCSSYKRKWWRF